MYKLCRDSQILTDIVEKSERQKMVRLRLRNGTLLEAVPDCFLYVSPNDDDEDVDAVRFVLPEGGETTLTGQEIEDFELVEEDHGQD